MGEVAAILSQFNQDDQFNDGSRWSIMTLVVWCKMWHKLQLCQETFLISQELTAVPLFLLNWSIAINQEHWLHLMDRIPFNERSQEEDIRWKSIMKLFFFIFGPLFWTSCEHQYRSYV